MFVLTTPVVVSRRGSKTQEYGLAVSSLAVSVDGETKVGWLVLWNQDNDRVPEAVPVEDLQWLSVPGISDKKDDDGEYDSVLDDLTLTTDPEDGEGVAMPGSGGGAIDPGQGE